MHRLSSMILLMSGFIPLLAQSPHGNESKIDCAQCHNSSGWTLDRETLVFDHATTAFALEGAHVEIDCKQCHTSLIFNEVQNQCMDCHTDMHSMSVGDDCARCHNTTSWLVNIIPEIHEENGFPLSGAHANLSCVECHTSETNLRFERIGNECINCHRDEYDHTQIPNHKDAGYSLNCIDCHNPLGYAWNAEVVTHDFFPLTLGHDIQDCNQCHTAGNFSDISPVCVNCHQDDFNNTANPNHISLNFSTDCVVCHTTDPDWTPARFTDHDAQFFPIYSGTHGGEWDNCSDCHTNPNDYSVVSCLSCHSNPETNSRHNGIPGYSYQSNACLLCHPNGEKGGVIDHDAQFFPIYGGKHKNEWNACTDCHTNPNNYAEFTCLTCHGKSGTDSHHREVADYVYESNACLQCHPRP